MPNQAEWAHTLHFPFDSIYSKLCTYLDWGRFFACIFGRTVIMERSVTKTVALDINMFAFH